MAPFQNSPGIARRSLLLALGALCSPWVCAEPPRAPALMLANVYRAGIDLTAYWVSEKYDGVRGFWDGQRLITRGGNAIQAPAWFTENWPDHALDGELWAGRGRFEFAMSTVQTETPNDAAWRQMRFMVFDLPSHTGTFDQRIPALQAAATRIAQPWVQAVEQTRMASHTALRQVLEKVVKDGGEGLMLHRGDSTYHGTRNDDLLKLKLFEDAEAQVIQHVPGNGKYQGLLGSLRVKTVDGRIFKVGSGLSDALRRDPPPLGTWITYRFQGTHNSGLPRFATYLRIRSDASLNERPESEKPQFR